ncbi:hypothetical protein [Rhodoferax sp.]|uniref:hypothetical protein n=1 Tax=Rhodoferax sp. TaxID=50421 RepID=UPI0025F63BD5|nr:hypothetical protein [Rhodoferax sp.]
MGKLRRRALPILVSLAALTLGSNAFASLGAHYLGWSRDQGEFRMYLDGGEFLGRTGPFQTIRVTVHLLRKGRPLRALEGCVYHFDELDRRRDQIACAEDAASPLRGVAYARDPQRGEKDANALEQMVCVRRCGRQVPQRVHLEEADEDNG